MAANALVFPVDVEVQEAPIGFQRFNPCVKIHIDLGMDEAAGVAMGMNPASERFDVFNCAGMRGVIGVKEFFEAEDVVKEDNELFAMTVRRSL